MAKTFKIGKAIKTNDRAGKENFYTPEMMGGAIALFNKSGAIAATRALHEKDGKQFFKFAGETYERKAI